MNVSYVGDHITAAALRLVGVETFVAQPGADAIWRAVQAARRGSALVIVDQTQAESIAERLTAVAIAEPVPPIVVMPTLDRDVQPLPPASCAARRVLGLEPRGPGNEG